MSWEWEVQGEAKAVNREWKISTSQVNWIFATGFESLYVPRATMDLTPLPPSTPHPVIISKVYTEPLEIKDDDGGWVQKAAPARKQ